MMLRMYTFYLCSHKPLRDWFMLHFSALGNAINKLSLNTNRSAQLLKSKLQAQVELQRTVSLTSRI